MIVSSILTFLYLISLVGYSKYQFIERDSNDPKVDAKANEEWHDYKFLNQVVFFASIALHSGFFTAVVLTFGYWIGFNTLINTKALNQPYYHLGNSKIDRWLKSTFGEKPAYFILWSVFAVLFVIKILYPKFLSLNNLIDLIS